MKNLNDGKMLSKTKTILIVIVCTVLINAKTIHAQTVPKYKADVPQSITTPDKVETKTLGTLEFFGGMPNEATIQKTYDYLDVSRGVKAFLDGIPLASIYAAMEGFKSVGVNPGDMAISEDLFDARELFLTTQTTTVFCIAEFDLSNGPIVFEVPEGVLGPIQDAGFRWISDVGLTGPDKGKGGKYLIVPDNYKGAIPAGYFVVKTPTLRNIGFFRAFVTDGNIPATVAAVKAVAKVYPLALKNPPKQRFVNVSGLKFNTIHSNDFTFYEEINAVIQKEPEGAFNAEFTGLLASIGIKKGQPFSPDARMKGLLNEAIAIGNATARSIAFAPRKNGIYYYPDRKWYSSFAGQYDFMDHGGLDLDARTLWLYIATGVTPAMSTPKPGTGSVYPMTCRDADGNYLDGGKTYSVTLPPNVPINNFWSFTVYSGQTRSILETDQKLGGLDSHSPSLKANADGSYTVWFGPKAPQGKEGNWIQTMPNESYFVFLRLYGPLQPWFDKTWKPGDLELAR